MFIFGKSKTSNITKGNVEYVNEIIFHQPVFMSRKKEINPNAVIKPMNECASSNASGIIVSATMDNMPPAARAVMKAILVSG